ncbi:MAG: collagen-like protein [Aulosira sp. DedQUE10]|nr:collagen-like protein [Aulosira sp. DedQUE10]
MYKGFVSKLPLLLTFCLFTSFLPASGSVLCPAFAHEEYGKGGKNYGTDGSKGTDGRSGRNGRAGQNQTIFVDGSPVNLNLAGDNGEDGEDGRRGSKSDCGDKHENVNHDIDAPSGGNGGDGGRGGDGGNGGSVTAYYTNLADLRQVLIRASGGESGRGGRGGNGGVGCNCRVRKWEVKSCTGTPGSPDYKCTEKVYRCHDGRDGRYGSDGSDGSRGRLGTLSIIQRKESLAGDLPTLQAAVAELTGKQFNLSKNKWNIRNGAVSLLASGSVIADEYREFDRRLEGAFQLNWQEKQPISSFGNPVATLNLNDSKEVEITFPEDLWVEGSSQTGANFTTFTVKNAIPKQDVTRLAVAEFVGAEQDLNLKIVDLAAKSQAIQTQFQVKFRSQDNSSGLSDYRTVYEGDIPAELVTRDYNRFTLALGKLPMSRSVALTPGVNVDIEVVATRSLGGRSAKQGINWQGAIRRGRQ